MTAPDIHQSTEDQRRAYVKEAWKCMSDCELCGKCRILKGNDPETIYADYIHGLRTYIEVTIQFRNSNY